MNFKQKNELKRSHISKKFVSSFKQILQSQPFTKYFKLIFLLTFCVVEIIDMNIEIFVNNREFSLIQNEYILYLILAFISLIMIPLLIYNVINQLLKEVIICCLLGCLFESFILNQKNILRFCAFFIFSQRTMNDMKKQKGSSIAIFVIVLYPLIRYSIYQNSNLSQLFQYFILLVVNMLFSQIKKPHIQTQQKKNHNDINKKNINKNNQIKNHNTNLSSITQNERETQGLQADNQYFNQTKNEQNSQIDITNNLNIYNISLDDDDVNPNVTLDISKIKSGQRINNIFKSESIREIYLNKKNLLKSQNILQIHENTQQTNQQNLNGQKINLNLISTGIIILDQNKKLIYTNKQCKKIIQQNKKQCVVDEVNLILSLSLLKNKYESQQPQMSKTNQQQNKNLSINEKFEKILEEQRQNRENEKNISSKGKNKQMQYGSVIYNQYQSSKICSINQEQDKQTDFQRNNFKKITTVEVISSDNQSETLNKKLLNSQLDSQKPSIQIESSLSQNNYFLYNQISNIDNQNTKSSLVVPQHNCLNKINSKKFPNKQEKSSQFPQSSSINYNESSSLRVIQCIIPCNIKKIFTKDNLLIDDIINFLIKFSFSPHNQQLNTDNQLSSEEDREEYNPYLQQQAKNYSESNKIKDNLTEFDYQRDEEESEYLDSSMQKQINDKVLIYKNNQLEKKFNNFKQTKIQTQDEIMFKNLKQKKKQNQNQNKQIYDYFVENNFLHLTINLEEDSLQKQKNTVIQIKLSVVIETEQDYERKFVQVEISDITKLKKKTDKENLDIYKNKILSSISHELRTPLNCSIQMLEMLTQNEEIPDILKQIFVFPALNSNCLLLNIINDILDLAQINYGKFIMQFSLFELNKIFTECVNLISMQALQKNLEIELDLDQNIPQRINSDQNRIRQVLLNLLSNALKFTQEGKITIRAALKEDNLILIDIEDTGCGISENNLITILKRFGKKDIYYFENQQSKCQLNTMGVGLGLTIANNLAAGLGGNRKLQISSVENVGSKFQFWIVDHPPNKIGCDFLERNIFSQEIVKWQSISEGSSKQQQSQQQLQQQIQIQLNSIKFSNNTITNLSPQSLLHFNNKNIKKNEESLNILNPNKFIQQPIQSLIKFNTEMIQNQNGHQSNLSQNNSISNPKQDSNSQISQNQSVNEVGKSKKFQLSFREQQQNCEEQSSTVDQQLYPQFFITNKTKVFYQNDSKKQDIENYQKSDSQFSLKNQNETSQRDRILEQDENFQNLNQQKQYNANQNFQNKEKDSPQIPMQTILENKNKSSLILFPTIKSSIQIPNKPSSNLLPNIILSVLHNQEQFQYNNIGKNINTKLALYPKSGDNSTQYISLFKSPIYTKEQREINEVQCDIMNSSEIQNIQIPNKFKLQKVSEKRSNESNHTSPSELKQQINSSNNPKLKQDFSANIKFQQMDDNKINQNNTLKDKLIQQKDQIQSKYQSLKDESLTEIEESWIQQSEEQKQITIMKEGNFDIQQQTSKGEKNNEIIQSEQKMNKSYFDRKAINSPKTPKSPHNLQQQLNFNLSSQNQSNNETENKMIAFSLDKKEQAQNQIFQKNPQIDNLNYTVKYKIQKYYSNKKCQCPNILIVDDNEFNIYALESRLKQYGFIVDKAFSGKVALQFVKKKLEEKIKQQCCKLYSLIFMDIDMPDKNGYETTKDILSYYKEQNIIETPLISACTAYIQQSEQIKARESGMKYYITKPINKQNLEELLSQMMQNFNIEY